MDRWINESEDRPMDPPIPAFPGRIYRIRRSTDPPRVCDIFQCADPISFNLDNESSIHQSTESPLVTLMTAISHV